MATLPTPTYTHFCKLVQRAGNHAPKSCCELGLGTYLPRGQEVWVRVTSAQREHSSQVLF